MLANPDFPFAILCGLTIANFVVYERLVKRQYEVARDAWEEDGRPPGFVWAPSGTSVKLSWSRNVAYFRWLFVTPQWIRQDMRATSLQRQFRGIAVAELALMLWIIALVWR